MTQFEHLELIYNQFLNLTDEINTLIENEEYTSAVTKLDHKNELIKKIQLTRKTVNFTEVEKQRINLIEQKIKEQEQKTLSSLENLQNDVGAEIVNIKKKVKVSTAYVIHSDRNQGALIDISE